MMGRQTGDQASLFYEFRLADRIPKDHLLRRINGFVGPVLGGVRGQLKSYYSEIGRPSVDPELMIRNVNYRLLLWPTVGTQVDPGSRIASGLSLVLPARS